MLGGLMPVHHYSQPNFLFQEGKKKERREIEILDQKQCSASPATPWVSQIIETPLGH